MGRIICCDCKTVIRKHPDLKGESHGYCDKCFAKAKKEVSRFIASRRKSKEAANRE